MQGNGSEVSREESESEIGSVERRQAENKHCCGKDEMSQRWAVPSISSANHVSTYQPSAN